jgi:AraC-like DNA-binding protein
MIHGGGGDERTRFICGYLGCDARPFNPLLAGLPSMLCARKPADGSGWVTDLFHLALAEGGSRRAGGETILAKLSELMFVEVIRRHLETLPEGSRGWLSGLRDPQVGAALGLIHARPTEDWTLERLAREVGLSRTIFAARFSSHVGISPMQYLARWRLQLAGRLLEQPGISIAQAGAEVGYESEAALNAARA